MNCGQNSVFLTCEIRIDSVWVPAWLMISNLWCLSWLGPFYTHMLIAHLIESKHFTFLFFFVSNISKINIMKSKQNQVRSACAWSLSIQCDVQLSSSKLFSRIFVLVKWKRIKRVCNITILWILCVWEWKERDFTI